MKKISYTPYIDFFKELNIPYTTQTSKNINNAHYKLMRLGNILRVRELICHIYI